MKTPLAIIDILEGSIEVYPDIVSFCEGENIHRNSVYNWLKNNELPKWKHNRIITKNIIIHEKTQPLKSETNE